jgi:N-glycosylase/DNA lyase
MKPANRAGTTEVTPGEDSEWVVPLGEGDAFNLALTLNSGQAFHWVAHNDGWKGVVAGYGGWLCQRGNRLHGQGIPRQVAEHYLALDHEIAMIHRSFPDHPRLRAAVAACGGMRILRQPLWECLAAFITSSMKRVSHISAMSHCLRGRFGRRLSTAVGELFVYPDAARVEEAGEARLRECGLGYRAPNLWRTAGLVASGAADLEGWRELSDVDLREALCGLPGVGVKVANCVMLFGYGRLAAVPVDVWIDRIVRESFLLGRRRITAVAVQKFCESGFGPYGGYAQQYLFHHARAMGGA